MPPLRYAVVGHPVEHSQSPFIHHRFAELTGRSLIYERQPCAPGDFAGLLDRLAADGYAGCNVTVPFKFEVPGLCASVSERARHAEAANTVRLDLPGRACDNTDGIGLVRDLLQHAGRAIAGARLLMIGAGGAAAGALGPLIAERPAELVVANRSPERAQALVARHAAMAAACGVPLRACGLDACQDGTERAFDLVVNASASSLAGAGSPVAPTVLGQRALALDMMYGAAAEPFLAWARAHGAHARDGLGMLVEQAAEAFVFFGGARPPTAGVLAELRERVRPGGR